MPRKNMIPEQEAAFLMGESKFFLNKRCAHGHISERYVKGGGCCECAQLRGNDRYEKTRQLIGGVKAEIELVDLAYARSRKFKFYFTGKPCKNGHISRRYVKSQECFDCSKIRIEKAKQERHEIKVSPEYQNRTKNCKRPKEPTIPGARIVYGRCDSGSP